jgi:hypothetical protein
MIFSDDDYCLLCPSVFKQYSGNGEDIFFAMDDCMTRCEEDILALIIKRKKDLENIKSNKYTKERQQVSKGKEMEEDTLDIRMMRKETEHCGRQ